MVEDILKSRIQGLHFSELLRLTEPHAAYPGKLPARRDGILRKLETLDAQTLGRIDTLVGQLRSAPLPSECDPIVGYMLRQRLRCALDVLARLQDSSPTPGWLCTASAALAVEDHWLLIGLWREFGACWLQNLAWRISRGIAD